MKNAYLGGTLAVDGITTIKVTTTSTTTSLGSLVTSGGLGVTENVYAGGDCVVEGAWRQAARGR